MKEIKDLIVPENVRYTQDHEWAESKNDSFRIGISDFAQDQLGDIVFVDMPPVGDTFQKGEEFGSVESVKAVSELYMPMGGEIVAVNTALEDAPELVNKAPYTEGWMVAVKPSDPKEFENLMTKEKYIEFLKGL